MKKTIFSLSLCLAASACSYSPMYKGASEHFSSGVSVGEVKIQGIKRNVGSRRMPQRLAQKLDKAFPSIGADYTLNVSLDEQTKALATSRTASDERYQLQVVANVTLTDLNGSAVLSTKLSELVAYNVQSTGYATDSEEEAAHERAIDRLSEAIIQQVHYKMYAMER